MECGFGNPSSLHRLGLMAEQRLSHCRRTVSEALGVPFSKLYFCSGGTEGNNTLINGAVSKNSRYGRHIITSLSEHSSVLEPIRALEKRGYEVTWLSPGKKGFISKEQVADALREDTVLISLMLVNNETGAVNEISGLRGMVEKKGSRALIHSDCVQAFLKVPFNALDFDLVTISSHKIHGPKGIGAVYCGAQLPPQHAAAIADELTRIDIFTGVRSMDYEQALAEGRIELLGEDCDRRFMANVMGMVNDYETVKKVADDFGLVYTPFHGCGYKLVPEALTRLGIKHLYCEPKQMVIDGDFPTVVSPNPENPEGFYLAIDLAREKNVDFILGTDPDSDRVGIMVRNKSGEFEPVTGNQTGVLLLDYLIGAMKRAGKLPAHPAALKTIVTTEMARAVAEANGLDCYDTFTGFKFMAEKMNELESAGKNTVIFSYEESYGYMIGHYVRDKDAVTASLLLTEMAAWYHAQGMTLFDALQALYEKYGWYGEKTHNLVMPGLDGLEKMAALMQSLRAQPPVEIGGVTVAQYKDYSDGTVRDAATGAITPMPLSGSNVLRFELTDGSHIVVRPSGTEPKIKVYILTKGADAAERDANLEKYSAWVKTLA